MTRAHRSSSALGSLLGVASFLSLILAAAPASAQDDRPPAAVPAEGVLSAPAPPAAHEDAAKAPSWSIALERVGGLAYAKASAKEGDDSLSVTAFGVGGVTPNPFAIPRLGIDYITGSGVTVGGGVGFSRISGSVNNRSKSEDIGSMLLYTLTPRVGYRIPLSERIDFTPRAGLTLAGASVSAADNGRSSSIFAVAVGADAPFVFRLTPSFNLLAGAAIDYTVAATVSTESSSGSSSRSRSEDVKGSLFSMQAWLGVGGYL